MFISLLIIQKHLATGNVLVCVIHISTSLCHSTHVQLSQHPCPQFHYLLFSNEIFSTSPVIHIHEYTVNLVIAETTQYPKSLIVIA